MTCDDDKLNEECGVFGIYGHEEAFGADGPWPACAPASRAGSLRHCFFDGENFYAHRALGLVGKTFGKKETIARLKGYLSIGHNRYSTTGETLVRNIQPLFADLAFGGLRLRITGI